MSDDEQPPRRPQGWAPRDLSATGPTLSAAPGGGARGPGGGRGEEPGTDEGNGQGQGKGNGDGKKKRPKRTGWRRAVPTWRMVLGAALVVALLLIGGFIAGYTLVHIPPANATATAQSNVFLYADGSQLARDGEINRENVRLAQIPLNVQHTVLAAEDRDFYSERAVDPKAMVRAAWNTLTGKGKQSGSTITQQYVKNYYLGQEQTISRKVKEFFIAIKLNREVSKADILEGYLNTSYFGRNAYGIQAASQAYYGKDIEKATTAEGAYLASLLNAPSAYDVVAHPENKAKAVARWNYVLDGMVKKKWMTPAERAAATFPAPAKARPAAGMAGQRGYVVEAVKDYLTNNKIIDENTLAMGGYRITTTLQKAKQDAFAAAVQDKVMSRVSADRKVDRNVRVGGASIDPDSGKVLAMYGGIDYTKQYVNNATRRDYQVGSTFKPFVFTSAVENDSKTQDARVITPNTIYDGTNKRFVQGWSGTPYNPANEDDKSYGPITVRSATDLSVNAVYAQMAVDVGPKSVRQTAIDLGIPSSTPDMPNGPSIALGTATASVLDMTQAYATLANHGKHGTYTMVESVTKDGEKVDLPAQDDKQAVPREAADTTTSILQSVVEGGTGTAAQASGRTAAGKTGTAEDDKAAWFAGYTPDLATVVAVMGQDPDTAAQKPLYGALGLPRMNGGGPPAQAWAQYTAAALKSAEPQDFDLQLQEGASVPPPVETQAPNPTNPNQPGQTEGQDQGQTEGRTEGQTEGGTTDGGTATGGPTNGGTTGGTTAATTDAGTTTGGTTGGPTNGGTTMGGTTDGGTTGGTTDGGPTTGGTTAATDGGNPTMGGTTTGTTAGGANRPRRPPRT
ncbi:transglycosylase domain-containing protein [Streptomyces sp. NPDC023838]|uniref:transglycosylase domain-containing protein n=1 Tax=Streptomyces sp. NPDC023838 TaxID=3154325 RepID=UPI0033C4C851